jgi:hypothetical protein
MNRPLRSGLEERQEHSELQPEKCANQMAACLVALFLVSRKGAAIFWKAAFFLSSKMFFLANLVA